MSRFSSVVNLSLIGCVFIYASTLPLSFTLWCLRGISNERVPKTVPHLLIFFFLVNDTFIHPRIQARSLGATWDHSLKPPPWHEAISIDLETSCTKEREKAVKEVENLFRCAQNRNDQKCSGYKRNCKWDKVTPQRDLQHILFLPLRPPGRSQQTLSLTRTTALAS